MLLSIILSRQTLVESPDAAVNNPVAADPLHFYDMCPVSDGAAAVILCPLEKAQEFTQNVPVVIAGFGQATDTHTLQERDDPTNLKAVTLASEQAFNMAGPILEIAESEHAGFFKKGEGGIAAENGETSLKGKIPINVSGGLKSRGHPVGATGVAQVVEIVFQLRHQLDEARQVKDAQVGFTLNFGGFGNNWIW